jgi:hypothetical protein
MISLDRLFAALTLGYAGKLLSESLMEHLVTLKVVAILMPWWAYVAKAGLENEP